MIDRTGSEATPVAVRRAMMDLLARREHSASELMQKLLKRFPDDRPLLEEELHRLQEEGLQSDARMAESFVRARVGRGQGPVRIRADLRQRGVDDGVTRDALADAEIDWELLAKDVATRRFGEELPRASRERARVIRFLQQRGFQFDHFRWYR